ncbi:protein kinase [Hymenobacter sp. 5516J-16]|uniref:protein kinase n=1 Tax=Hymenobacter sp. 5516J-16 TaxID=2932253 RepID=UPI001FD428F2|nr:protein kinase [Hymenobacter sp. 5516J-16]UOQ77673.1 protein kinase [Hymenobacter sp. 5516J-16]
MAADHARLTWLAFAGNPFSEPAEAAAEARNPMQSIDWGNLQIEQQLGEGASGWIYRAQWQPAAAPTEAVAVKLFKGALTSDGLPRSEMVACMSAGVHPNLVAVKGKVAHHADREGLVLELIDPAFRNLAGPPSFATCTRDVYAPDLHFSLEATLRLVRGIAGATAHLHARGILHGDLYAHNILYTPAGDSLLSDFGAACFFDPAETSTAPALQRLETRAFGCLLEELLARTEVPAAAAGTFQHLLALQQQCLQPEVAARPLLIEIQGGWRTCRKLRRGKSAEIVPGTYAHLVWAQWVLRPAAPARRRRWPRHRRAPLRAG